MYKHKINWNN